MSLIEQKLAALRMEDALGPSPSDRLEVYESFRDQIEAKALEQKKLVFVPARIVTRDIAKDGEVAAYVYATSRKPKKGEIDLTAEAIDEFTDREKADLAEALRRFAREHPRTRGANREQMEAIADKLGISDLRRKPRAKRQERAKPAEKITDVGEKIGGARKDKDKRRKLIDDKGNADPRRIDLVLERAGRQNSRLSLLDQNSDGTFTFGYTRGRSVYSLRKPLTQSDLNDLARGKEITDGRSTIRMKPERPSRSKGASESLPPWERRFIAAEKIDRVTGKGTGKWTLIDTQSKFGGSFREEFASREAAENMRVLAYLALKHRVVMRPGENGESKFVIVRDVTDRKRVRIGTQEFTTREAAQWYMISNAEQIINTKTGYGEEVLSVPNKDFRRRGPEYRKGPVEGQQFLDDFKLRGVEFGNWNNQRERQEVMNEAYDALRDLADVLKLKPEAIGLGGELGLAFGARGHGLSGARAHYETDYGAINLTKMGGAGSLGHEWLHAFDHYLARLDGPALRERVENRAGDKVFKIAGDRALLSRYERGHKDLPETVRFAWKALVTGLFHKREVFQEDRTKQERFLARSREAMADELKRVRAYLERELTYGKRNTKPATAEQLRRFDEAASRIVAGDLEVEWRPNNPDKPARSRGGMSGRWSNDALDDISAVLKEVRGTAGFTSDRKGTLDLVADAMRRTKRRLDEIRASEATGNASTRFVRTEFAMNARAIDEGRIKDYWTTNQEMLARAFEAYLEDKVAEAGQRSDFLSFGADNRLYAAYGIKPYPEGDERRHFNALFDGLFEEIRRLGVLPGAKVDQDDE